MGSVPRTTLLESDRRDGEAGEAGAPSLRPRLRPGRQDGNRRGVPRRAATRTCGRLRDEGTVWAAAPEEPQKRREREVPSRVDVGWRPPDATVTGGWDGAPNPGPRRLTCRPRNEEEETGSTESENPSARRDSNTDGWPAWPISERPGAVRTGADCQWEAATLATPPARWRLCFRGERHAGRGGKRNSLGTAARAADECEGLAACG